MFWTCTAPYTIESASKLTAVGSFTIQRKNCVKAQTPAGDTKALHWGWKEQLWSLGGQIPAISVSEWQLVGVLQSCHITALTWGNWEHVEELNKMVIGGLQWLSSVKVALQAKVFRTEIKLRSVEGEHWRLFGLLLTSKPLEKSIFPPCPDYLPASVGFKPLGAPMQV